MWTVWNRLSVNQSKHPKASWYLYGHTAFNRSIEIKIDYLAQVRKYQHMKCVKQISSWNSQQTKVDLDCQSFDETLSRIKLH